MIVSFLCSRLLLLQNDVQEIADPRLGKPTPHMPQDTYDQDPTRWMHANPLLVRCSDDVLNCCLVLPPCLKLQQQYFQQLEAKRTRRMAPHVQPQQQMLPPVHQMFSDQGYDSRQLLYPQDQLYQHPQLQQLQQQQLLQQQQQQRQQFYYPSVEQPPHNNSLQRKQYDGANDDEDGDGLLSDKEDDEELNQLILPENEVVSNFVMCLYEKVERSKNKRKCSLRYGVMHLAGRDYVFNSCTAEFPWE